MRGKREKKEEGWGSHCHADWCSAQTAASGAQREEAEVRCEGLWHLLLSGDAGSFCRRSALEAGAFCSLSLFTSQVQGVSSRCQAGLRLLPLNWGRCAPRRRLRGPNVPEMMAEARGLQPGPGRGSEETWGVSTAEPNAKPNTCGDMASPWVMSAD